jgi:LDH2 family malate/lactate/ureidoglycolate dehydrogenase
MDSGHKGYGFSLLVEALTGGLAGHGRADEREGWGATVFVQILDPRAFSGIDAFNSQMAAVSQQCHASKPAQPGQTVRTPGERGLMLANEQRAKGVSLHASIIPMLQPWAEKLRVAMPTQMAA